MVRLFHCAALLLTLVSCLLPLATADKTLLLAGGYISDGNSEIWNKIVTLAGGRGVAKVGIITAANAEPIAQGRRYKALFESYGVAEAYWIPIYEGNPGAASNEEVIKKIKEMTGFFFGGGAQQRIIQTLLMKDRQPTPAFAAMRELYENGTVVSGTSAGAMVMPSVVTMVDGTSYQALVTGAVKVGEETRQNELVYDSKGGLGLIGGHTIDSHFHERGRQGRLIRLLVDTRGEDLGTNYGLGIDEETAIVVTDVGTSKEKAEVIGQAGVFYADVSKAYVDPSTQPWRVLSVFASYATAGDVIDLVEHTVTVSSTKVLLKGNETRNSATTSNDIFRQALAGTLSEFRQVAQNLFDSRFDSLTYGTTIQVLPRFYVIMTEDSISVGHVEVGGINPPISYTNMKLEIRPTDEENI